MSYTTYKTKKKVVYKLGDIVTSKIDLFDESRSIVPAGTLLRLVAFAAKVRKYAVSDPTKDDSEDYFYNAVRASQPTNDDFSNRIRANFVTISEPISNG